MVLNSDEIKTIIYRAKFFIAELCDFGVEPTLQTCDWVNRNGSVFHWELGAGVLSNWLGGPPKDAGGREDADRGNL